MLEPVNANYSLKPFIRIVSFNFPWIISLVLQLRKPTWSGEVSQGKPCRAQVTHLSVPRARVLPTPRRAAGCALGLDPGMPERGVALPSQPELRGSRGPGAEFCLRDQEEVRVRGQCTLREPKGGVRCHSGT